MKKPKRRYPKQSVLYDASGFAVINLNWLGGYGFRVIVHDRDHMEYKALTWTEAVQIVLAARKELDEFRRLFGRT